MARARKGKRAAAREATTKFPVRTTLIVLGWLGLLGSFVLGARALEQEVLRGPVVATKIEWVDLPGWLQQPQWGEILEQIEEAAHKPMPLPVPFTEMDIHDDKVCNYVYTVVWGSPWVEHVDRVVKMRDGRVRVHARFRAPYAVVERSGMAYLIDSQGVRLPGQWSAEIDEEGRSWLRIVGVDSMLPPIGERFLGEKLQAGLKLASFLYVAAEEDLVGQQASGMTFLDELESIDVSEFDENLGGLRIFPKGTRSYIYWGHVPGGGLGVEATAEQKLAVLRTVYRNGRLRASSPYRISDGREITFIRDFGG